MEWDILKILEQDVHCTAENPLKCQNRLLIQPRQENKSCLHRETKQNKTPISSVLEAAAIEFTNKGSKLKLFILFHRYFDQY